CVERVLLRSRPPANPRQDDPAAASGAVRRDRGDRQARAACRECLARDAPEPGPVHHHPALADQRSPLRGGQGLAMASSPRANPHQKGGTSMRRFLVLGAVAVLCAALVAAAAFASPKKHSVVNLTFATYVWQPTTVAATKQIVDSWNASHPGIQV